MPVELKTHSNPSDGGAFKLLLIAVCLEGFITFPFFFQIPSMERSTWLFGLSITRWLVILAFSMILILLTAFTIYHQLNQHWARSIRAGIDTFLADPAKFWQSLFGVTLLSVFGCVILISFNIGPEDLKTSFFGVVFFRLEPFIAWMTLTLVEIALYLVLKSRTSPPALNKRYLSLTVVVISLAITAAFVYWFTLYLDLPWVSSLKNWFWLHNDKGGIHGVRFVGLWLLSLLVFFLVYKKLRSAKLGLAILIGFGYILMVGIGFVGGDNGFETLQRIHLNMNSQADYSYFVSHRWVTPWLVITQYEDFANDSILSGSKPPGTLLIYSVTQQISEALLHPADNVTDRLEKLTEVISVVFPFLTVLTLLPLYKVARRFLDEREALIPCILYLSVANVLLMPLGLDKALTPGLFMVGLYLILKISRGRKFMACLGLGLYLFIALFFSFSLLPLLLWAPLWFLVDDFNQNRKAIWTQLARPLIGVGLGFLITAVIFWFALNYNILTRYIHTLYWLRVVSHYEYSFTYFWETLIGNNIELAAWSSFPLILITIVQVVLSIIFAIKHRARHMDLFLIVFLIVYGLLNINSQVNAEVGRTWLFMETIFVLATGYFISHTSHLRVPALLSLAAVQLVTVYFLLAYQCPCWAPY